MTERGEWKEKIGHTKIEGESSVIVSADHHQELAFLGLASKRHLTHQYPVPMVSDLARDVGMSGCAQEAIILTTI